MLVALDNSICLMHTFKCNVVDLKQFTLPRLFLASPVLPLHSPINQSETVTTAQNWFSGYPGNRV